MQPQQKRQKHHYSFPEQEIKSSRAWVKDSPLGKIVHEFSQATQEEVGAYIKETLHERYPTRESIEQIEFDPQQLPNLAQEIEYVRPQVDSGRGFVVFPAWQGFTVHQSRGASWLVANAFGETRAQDDLGSRLIEIYNVSDALSMRTGARYHVTREGNSPHTDAPQVPDDPDYLCLRCVNQSLVGGENILVTADAIYNYMLKNHPERISMLTQDFIFERRGVEKKKGDDFFLAPILSRDEEGLRLRFLDHYIRRGHQLAGKPLTFEQERAIQYLNSLFEQSDLQFRARLQPGQQVVFANKRMLHARTEFTDPNQGSEIYDPKALDDLKSANRLMDRTWSYKRH